MIWLAEHPGALIVVDLLVAVAIATLFLRRQA